VNQQLVSDFASWNNTPSTDAGPGILRQLMQWFGLAASPAAALHWRRNAKPSPRSNHALFKVGDPMLQRAREASQPLSVAVFEFYDLPELETVFGPRVAEQAIDQVLGTLKRLAGRKGTAHRTSSTAFAVLLPQLWLDDALAAVHAAFGHSWCIDIEADGEEIVLVPDFRIQTVRDGHSLQSEYKSLCCEIGQAHERKQRRLDYLERERKSHSRPLRLRAAAGGTGPGEFARDIVSKDLHSPIAATEPMPLERH
jgi:GGDEF domain-containing protein